MQRGSDTRETVAYFDKIADRYQGLYEEDTPVGYSFTVRRQRVLELFDADGGKVLDVGCGPGVMGHALRERGCDFWGVDPSSRMIEVAEATFSADPRARFQVGIATGLDFPDGFFDAVICMGVLERVADDGAALAEMVRVLKPGGTLIVTVPNRWSPALLWRDNVLYPVAAVIRPLYRKRSGHEGRPAIRGHRRYSARRFGASLRQKDCEVSEVAYCVYNLLPAPFDSMLPSLGTKALRAAERLHCSRLRSIGAAMVVKARKRSDP